MLWLAVKLPVRRCEFSVLQMDVEVCGTLSVPVAKSPAAPAAIAITSIAITLAFTVDPCLDHELYVFNRLVTGRCCAVHQACQKVRIIRQPKEDGNKPVVFILAGA